MVFSGRGPRRHAGSLRYVLVSHQPTLCMASSQVAYVILANQGISD